jgi:hypothetical protein
VYYLDYVTDPDTGKQYEVTRIMAVNSDRVWYAVFDADAPNDFSERYVRVEGDSKVWSKWQYKLPTARFDGFNLVDSED